MEIIFNFQRRDQEHDLNIIDTEACSNERYQRSGKGSGSLRHIIGCNIEPGHKYDGNNIIYAMVCTGSIHMFDVPNINSKRLIASDSSNMTELLQLFKRFDDLHIDTTYNYNFGGKQSVKYLKQNSVDSVQVSIKNEDEYIDQFIRCTN